MMIINEFLLKRSIETRYYPIVEFKMVLRQLVYLTFLFLNCYPKILGTVYIFFVIFLHLLPAGMNEYIPV